MKTSKRNAPRLRFLGAAGTVTGSRFLLETEDAQILIDCGLYQGAKELRLRNWNPWPADLDKLSACVLTHAHIDHSGYLPRLFQLGYSGPVYCTHGTGDLLKILLPDAAHLQVADAKFANRKGFSKHHPARPLYDENDAAKALNNLQPTSYRESVALPGGMELSFHPAGHLLGSASALLSWGEGSEKRRLLVSGDLGKYDDAYMANPEPPRDPIDYLLIESTYGNRLHPDLDVEEQLAAEVHAAVARGGVLLVPSFAVGRAQELLFFLGRLERAGRIPVLDVVVDSPMAINATNTYRTHRADLNFEWSDGDSPLATKRTRFTRTTDQSKALSSVDGPAIIISASGMATGGRIVHHLARLVGDPRNTVMFAGFQAYGTRGRRLVDGADTIRMFGEDWPVRAQVINLFGMSAHGDADDLLRWAGSLASKPRRTWVVHGEPKSAEALADRLETELNHDTSVAGLDGSARLV